MSAVKCGGGVSSFFHVNTGVRRGCVLAPSLFNTCMDWVLGRVVEQIHYGASVGNTKITDLVFADDAAIFVESLEVLVMALEALHEEVKPLTLKVSWAKTKVQLLGGLLEGTVYYVHACGEDIEILEKFTYLGSVVVHNDGGSSQQVTRRIVLYGLTQHEYLALSIPVQTNKDSYLQVACDPCLTLWLRDMDIEHRPEEAN